MSYEKYKGFVIESVDYEDLNSYGKAFTNTAIVIRRVGYPKILKDVLTFDDGRAWIDRQEGGEA